MKSDIEVAREYALAPIADIAAKLGVPETALRPYGRVIAKLDRDFLDTLGRPAARASSSSSPRSIRRRPARARRRRPSASATR